MGSKIVLGIIVLAVTLGVSLSAVHWLDADGWYTKLIMYLAGLWAGIELNLVTNWKGFGSRSSLK